MNDSEYEVYIYRDSGVVPGNITIRGEIPTGVDKYLVEASDAVAIDKATDRTLYLFRSIARLELAERHLESIGWTCAAAAICD